MHPTRTTLAPAAVIGTALLLLSPPAVAGERSYQVLRWAEDWSWIEADPDRGADAFDEVKWVPLGDAAWFTFGGSIRLRGEADDNRTLKGDDDDALLRGRIFLHGALGHRRSFRWYWEVRASDTSGSDRTVPALFEDDPDVQNFFLEATAASETTHPVTVRVGRQELLLGAQRLVSPLDWVSTRRTFDGLTVTASSPRTKTVVFATSPVLHEEHDVDSPDEHVLFCGAHASVEMERAGVVEPYLYWRRDDRDTFVSEDGSRTGDLERWTLGARYRWSGERWAAETEWALQDGEIAGDDVSAFFGTVQVERTWGGAAWKPKLTVGLDHASGDGDRGDGERGTFDHLWPLGHAYFGHLDLVGRQNVRAARVEVALKPRPRLTWVTALHRFELASAADALYDAGGAVKRPGGVPGAGRQVGTEIDSLIKVKLGLHQSVEFEITHFWADSFIERTGSGEDATFAWAAWDFVF